MLQIERGQGGKSLRMITEKGEIFICMGTWAPQPGCGSSPWSTSRDWIPPDVTQQGIHYTRHGLSASPGKEARCSCEDLADVHRGSLPSITQLPAWALLKRKINGTTCCSFGQGRLGREYISLHDTKLYNCQSQASKVILFSPKLFSSSNYI